MTVLVSLFLAWDGLGISSFLLVVFYRKYSSLGGGLLTVCVNRGGDSLLCLRMARFFGGRDFFTLAGIPGVCSILFTVAAFTKSAQWPFSA